MTKQDYTGRSDVMPFDDATDLQHRVARSFALVTDWIGALIGRYDLGDVLATLARQTQAAHVALYRIDPESGRVQGILSHQRVPGRAAPATTGALARFVLAQDGAGLVNGSIWRLSEMRGRPDFAASEAAREWAARPDNLECSLIVMERRAQALDLLEISFESAPPRSPELPTSIVTKALSDVWGMRRPGVIQALIAAQARRRAAPHLGDSRVLGADNPYALTPAEMRTCQLLVSGQPAKAIAARLDLSVATVRTHLRNIYAKTGTEGQVALIAWRGRAAMDSLLAGIGALPLAGLLAPLLVMTVLWDLRQLRLPNGLVLAYLALFALAVAPGLSGAELGVRALAGGLVLALGLAAFAGGLLGGGDAKLLAALVLFVPPGGYALFAFVLALCLLASILVIQGLRRARPGARSGWRFLHDTGRLPMGVAFGTAGLLYWGWLVP